MSKHSHSFVEEYDGLVGYGYSREVNEHTLEYYLQKFSDDKLASLILSRMSDKDMDTFFNLIGDFLNRYLSEEEYHSVFLKEEE